MTAQNEAPYHDDGVRHRRTQSVTRAEEIQEVEKKIRQKQPDRPIHKPRDSLLSWNSGFENFTGFVNWAFLLLSIGGLRLLLENFIKYGIRVDPLEWLCILTGQDDSSEYPSILLISYTGVPILFCLLIEKALAIEIIPNVVGMTLHVGNLIVLLTLPVVAIHVKDSFSLVGASTVTFVYSVLFLKLWSYIQVNMWCRNARIQSNSNQLRRQSLSFSNLKNARNKDTKEKNGDQEEEGEKFVQYPDNLRLKDLFYFLFAPTLCYELNFPRTQRIRKRFLIKRIFECLAGTQLILAVFQQYMIPSVKNSLIPFSNMEFALATERLLKLALPNHLIWLCMFYILFHSWLNLLGELLQFADRNFYADWWNANNIDTFWRTWNLPVHRWALRHLYFPMIEMGYDKTICSVTVFFISAFFHEYMVSVPLRTYKIWAFLGMMGQIPLSSVSKIIEKKYGAKWGNIIVWASLILGQPLCIMMYYHDYVVNRYGESLLEDWGHV